MPVMPIITVNFTTAVGSFVNANPDSPTKGYVWLVAHNNLWNAGEFSVKTALTPSKFTPGVKTAMATSLTNAL